MSSTLKDLWYGNIAPFDRCGIRDAELNQLSVLMARNKEALCSITTPQQQAVFQKYIDCAEEFLIHQMELAFCEGFSLSCKLLTESFSHDSE